MMTRKTKLGVTIAGSAVLLVAVTGLASSVGATRAGTSSTDPAGWRPWHLSSAKQFRLKAPAAAKSATTKTEIAQLLRLQAKRTRQSLKTCKKWNAQPAVIPWTNTLIDAINAYRPRPPVASYDLAIFYTGLYDAMIAAYDSRDAYAATSRPAPSKLDPRVKSLFPTSGSTWAPYQAAMAGAAEQMLIYMFPDASPVQYHKLATEAVNSRLTAGLNYRSDVEQARALGRKVAAVVISQAQTDGRATKTGFPYPRLTGEGYWAPAPPGYEPPFGGPTGLWRPWLMSSADQFLHLIPGPSPYGSPEYMTQLQAVISTVKNESEKQKRTAFFWDAGPGTPTPAGLWLEIARDLIKQYKTSGEQAVRALAYLGPAEADAAVAAWNTKYYYWQPRPIIGVWRLCEGGSKFCTEAALEKNPSLATYRGTWYSPITTPPHPAYPSGHATFSAAASAVLEYFFPAAAAKVKAMAAEAAQSRVYGGIHYPEDSRDGLILGRAVGNLAVQKATTDGGQR